MEVVEFESLDEGAVEHRCGRRSGGPAGTDDNGCSGRFQRQNRIGCHPRPRQLRADERAAEPVEQQVLRSFDDPIRNIFVKEEILSLYLSSGESDERYFFIDASVVRLIHSFASFGE